MFNLSVKRTQQMLHYSALLVGWQSSHTPSELSVATAFLAFELFASLYPSWLILGGKM